MDANGWACVGKEGEHGNTEPARRQWVWDAGVLMPAGGEKRLLHATEDGWAAVAARGERSNTVPALRVWEWTAVPTDGRLVYTSGQSYTGQMLDGKPHGVGKFVYEDGQVYEGGWELGLRHGRGVIRTPAGLDFEGEWVRQVDDWRPAIPWRQRIAALRYIDDTLFVSHRMI